MRCFLFPHTRFIRYWESLPAYAWKGFLFVRIFLESRNNSPFSPCSYYGGKEKSKFFHSEGLKMRGCFVYGEGYPILQKKLNTFFDNTGVFRQVFVLRRWGDFSKNFPIRAKKQLPLVLRRWGKFVNNLKISEKVLSKRLFFWTPLSKEDGGYSLSDDPWQLNDRPNGIWLCHDTERSSEATLRWDSGAGTQTNQSGKAANPVI